MKSAFKFLIFAFSCLLLSVFCSTGILAATEAYGQFQDGSTSATINMNDSAVFNAVVVSLNPPINVDIYLINSNGDRIYTIYNAQVSDFLNQWFIITPAMYGSTAGNYNIIVEGTDTFNDQARQIYTLTVNSGTTITHTLVLNPVNDRTVTEDEEFEITFHATDSLGDAITYSLDSADVDSDEYDFDGQTMTWKPEDHGTYTFTVTATDGTLTDTETFDVTVEKADHQLTITSMSVSSNTVYPGDVITVEIKIENEGNIDEEDVDATVKISALGISSTTKEFDLDKDDTIKKTLQLIIPSSASKGTYTLTATTDDDTATETITVRERATTIVSDTSDEEFQTEIIPTGQVSSGIGTEYIVLGGVALVLVICLLVYMSSLGKIRRVSI